MRTIILDCPSVSAVCENWNALEIFGQVERYASTTLAELLQRGRTADVVVSWNVPFRREVLDYLTRPRFIFVPEHRMQTLVEGEIAAQLGIRVWSFQFDRQNPCIWIHEIADKLNNSDLLG